MNGGEACRAKVRGDEEERRGICRMLHGFSRGDGLILNGFWAARRITSFRR